MAITLIQPFNLSNTANYQFGNVTSGNVLTGGVVSATGNVTGNYIIGNGSQLTGLPASYANANVAAYLASGTDSSNIITTANVTGGNVLTSGLISAAGNISAAGITVAGSGGDISGPVNITATGNVIGGNLLTVGVVSATGNVTGNYIIGNGSQLTGLPASYSNANVAAYLPTYSGNLSPGNLTTTGLVSVTGNVVGGNFVTAGLITATGNITGNYIIGNGSQLTGLPASYSNANVAAYLPTYSGNISANNISITTSLTGNIASLSGNITGGNLLTAGLVSAASHIGSVVSVTANVTGGNVLTGGLISAAGNITGGNLSTAGAGGNITGANVIFSTTMSATANVVAGNVTTAGLVSAAGNVTGNYFIGNGGLLTGLYANSNAVGYGEAGWAGNIIPSANAVYSLGTATKQWKSLYISNSTMYIDNVAISIGAGNTLQVAGANVVTTSANNAISVTGNVTGGNILTGGLVSATGTITSAANVAGNNVVATNWVKGANISATGNVLVDGYVSVVGNLYVANIVSSSNLVVVDPLVYFTANSTYPYNYDIGFYSQFTGDPGNTYQHTGFIRDATDNTWKLFSNVVAEPTTTIDLNNAIYDPIVVGVLTANSGLFSNVVSATGNITTAALFVGNGSALTGVTASSVAASALTGTTLSSNVVNSSLTSLGTLGSLTVTANTTSGNLLTGGLISATSTITSAADITGGNILTGGLVSATANITGGNVLTGGLISATSTITSAANITGGNVLTGGLISATSTITSAANITGGNVLTGGLVSATGNITSAGNVAASYFIGNGSQLTGLPTAYSNAAVAAYLASGTDSSDIVTTANVSGGNLVTTGLVSAASYVGSVVSITANVTGGNVLTGGLISATGNITSAGNISATYYIGNGSLLTGISASVSKIVNGTSEANIGTSDGNANISIGGTANVAVFANTGVYVTGVVSASGNVTGSNVLTGGLISSAGNITSGNLLTGGAISATGNITGGNILGGANVNATTHTGATASLSGNVTGGNVLTAGLISATGNISSAGNISGTYYIGNGSLLTGITASYPGSGIANSTGSAWGTSYSTSGSGTTVALTTGAAFDQETYSTAATVTAGTNAQGQGALTSDVNIITTTSANPSGVTLPTATTGRRIIIVNKGTNPISVYPASGGAIDALGSNAALIVGVGNFVMFTASSTTQWYSTVNNVLPTEVVFTASDATSLDINPSNGTIQLWTLTATRTLTANNFGNGQSVTMMVTAGAYTITWPATTWVGGTPPTLSTTAKTVIELWKAGGTLYGANVGNT